MAVQTVVSLISLVLITTVISELYNHKNKIKVERALQDDDDDSSGSGLRITDTFTADRNIPREDDVGTGDPIRDVRSLIPVDISQELVTVESSTLLFKVTEEASISPSREEWTSADHNSLSDHPISTSMKGVTTQEPPFENLMEISSEDLPSYVIEKGGRKYLDISSVNMTELKLQNLTDVYGISAENGPRCKMRKLVITQNYHVHRNILECHTLKTLMLSGQKWICLQDWSWLEEPMGREIALHANDAYCEDLRLPGSGKYGRFTRLPFVEGIETLKRMGIKDCPEKCYSCLTVLTKEKMFDYFRLYCDHCNLTDDDVPSIPTYATQLFLEGNKLRSTQKLFNHLEHLENIDTVQLDGNKLDAIPFLKKNAFKKLNRLSLADNGIRKVDVKAFESIVEREDMVLFLRGNHFPCDCNSHFLLKLCLENVKKVNDIIKYPLQCINLTNNVMELLTLRDECEPQISDPPDLMPILLVFLGLLNIIFIYFVYDLVMAIRDLRGQGIHVREPKLHHLVKGTQRFMRCGFKNRREEDRERSIDAHGLRSHDTPVTLRANRLSSVDRDASTMRTDRRRLTPCPN